MAGKPDPEGKAVFEAGGVSYTAFFGFRAMKEVERHFDKPFMLALQSAMPSFDPADAGDEAKVAAAGASLRVEHVGVLFGFSLMKYHPALTEDEIDDLIDEIGLKRAGEVLGEAIAASLADAGDGEGGGGDAAPGPRKAARRPA